MYNPPSDDEMLLDDGTLGGLPARVVAGTWAQEVLKNQHRVSTADRPYVEAVLIEVGMFEVPIKELAVGINDNGDHYKITIKGYKNLIDDVKWINKFMGKERPTLLDNVSRSFTQLTDSGAIKVLQVEKVQLQSAQSGRRLASSGLRPEEDDHEFYPPSSSASHRSSSSHRGGGSHHHSQRSARGSSIKRR